MSLQDGPESCPVTLTASVTWGRSRPWLAHTNQKLSALPTAALFPWCYPHLVPTQRGALGAVRGASLASDTAMHVTQVNDELFQQVYPTLSPTRRLACRESCCIPRGGGL